MRALRYAFDEAIVSLWRRRPSGLLSTGTIALALFVLGAFLVVTTNLQRLGNEWENAAEMSVYLSDEISAEERQAIERAVDRSGLAAGREFVSKADALERFKRTFADLAAAIETVGSNPLPSSIEVRLQPGGADNLGVERLGEALRQMPGVSDVRYDREWLGRMMAAVRIVRNLGLALAAVLTLASALTVANVVRLGLVARRDELEIMHLVGAPAAYIRGPFVMEGVLQGGAGAAVALVALAALFLFVRARYLVEVAPAIDVSALRFLSVELCAVLIAGGMVVGCLGGLVAGWRFSHP
jgi:cell division transport system permease protein